MGCECNETPFRVSAEPNAPIACTIGSWSDAEMRAHAAAYRAAFTHMVRTERDTHVLRWTFRDEPGLEHALRELAAREHACCAFFTFEIARVDGHLAWTTRTEATAMLEQLAALPERLARDPLEVQLSGA